MLGQERDGGSLEFECSSLMLDCEDCASGFVCGDCGGEDDEFEETFPDVCDCCDRTSQDDAAHLPDEGRASRNVQKETAESEICLI